MVKVINNNFKRNICPFCGTSKISRLAPLHYKKPIKYSTVKVELSELPELWKCKACDSKFIQNAIPEDEAIKLYQCGDSGIRWSFSPMDADKPKEILDNLRFNIKDSSILDIGASTGALLDFAKTLNCKTSGVEYSESARAVLNKKGHKVFSSFDEVEEKYDIITAFDLVEHLYDFNSFITKCFNSLNKNGLLIILTGNPNCNTARLLGGKWWYYNFPEHVIFPSLQFFNLKISNFNLIKVVPTYNGLLYMSSNWLKFLKKFYLILKLEKAYQGIPSIGADHNLYILKKIAYKEKL
ncbi:MAG: class I SAM-dependent methyltransferase [Bacteroidota bacterium]|nr:class I SAM-dependent methyltransferase [Bacteroidota bacterium]